MIVDPKHKLDKCVSQDITRSSLNHPYLDVDKKRLVATNGHLMVCVPVEEVDRDSSGMIPLAALTAAAKNKLPTPIDANGDVKVLGVSYPRPDGKFPPYEQVLPKFKDGDEGTITFGVNLEYIVTLAKALNAKVVKITLQRGDDGQVLDGMLVEPLTPNGASGCLMPCRVR